MVPRASSLPGHSFDRHIWTHFIRDIKISVYSIFDLIRLWRNKSSILCLCIPKWNKYVFTSTRRQIQILFHKCIFLSVSKSTKNNESLNTYVIYIAVWTLNLTFPSFCTPHYNLIHSGGGVSDVIYERSDLTMFGTDRDTIWSHQFYKYYTKK